MQTLTFDELLRSFKQNKDTPHSLLLNAKTSVNLIFDLLQIASRNGNERYSCHKILLLSMLIVISKLTMSIMPYSVGLTAREDFQLTVLMMNTRSMPKKHIQFPMIDVSIFNIWWRE